METTLEATMEREPPGPGPQAEIEYWAEQNATLTALAEQLESKQVRWLLLLAAAARCLRACRCHRATWCAFSIHLDAFKRAHTDAHTHVCTHACTHTHTRSPYFLFPLSPLALSRLQVMHVVDLLRSVHCPELEAWDFHSTQLVRRRAEAKDNLRFLSTLERHFKNIAQASTFDHAAGVTERVRACVCVCVVLGWLLGAGVVLVT